MGSCERFDETTYLMTKICIVGLNMGHITDIDYKHAKRVFKVFNNRNIGDNHNLYVRSDTLLLADVFENFRNMWKE